MPIYKIIRIKILSDKQPELIQLLDTKSESKNELDTISVFTEDTNMLSNAYKDSQEHGIKLTINDKAVDSIYEHEYISITACFHWKVTNDNIDNVDKTYLIGTNIITKLNDNIPIVKIESSSESIKYKKLVRDNSKKIFGIRNKDIITIKHLNNNANYHNYLIIWFFFEFQYTPYHICLPIRGVRNRTRRIKYGTIWKPKYRIGKKIN